jgi:hypothetical protein
MSEMKNASLEASQRLAAHRENKCNDSLYNIVTKYESWYITRSQKWASNLNIIIPLLPERRYSAHCPPLENKFQKFSGVQKLRSPGMYAQWPETPLGELREGQS